MYPFIMYTKPFPTGDPVYFKGEYQEDKYYPLYILRVSCRFYLKDDMLPTIQLKHTTWNFCETEYLTSSEQQDGTDEPIVLTMTNVDFQLFQEHYDLEELTYIDGWKFAAMYGLFNEYIEFWYHVKETAAKSGKPGLKQVAKLMLNNLYGKFGTRGKVGSKIPYLDDGVLKFHLDEPEDREMVYVPLAIFVTSWARDYVIRLGQMNIKYLCYIDTDSLHLIGDEVIGLKIDKFELGAWDEELKFEKAKFIRTKAYLEMFHVKLIPKKGEGFKKLKFKKYFLPGISGRWKKWIQEGCLGKNLKCAGMPSTVHHFVNMENFCVGSAFEGKLQSKNVKGGQVLIPVPFSIKG